MPVPDFQQFMLPLLLELADGKEHKLNDVTERLAARFALSEEDQQEILPSGRQTTFKNRTGWARTYMKKAGLLETPRRATVCITQKGLDVLRTNPPTINVKFLKQFPEFVEFHEAKRNDRDTGDLLPVSDDSNQTPEELLEVGYQTIRESLAQELISKILSLSPSFFERLVVELLVKMGYGGSIKDAGRAIGKSGDEGIDGTIKEDKLGLDVIYIQAKRWQPGNIVGRPELHKFVGALAGQGAKKGIFITTSSFSKDAREYVPRNETKIVLIDGDELAQLMIDYSLGVSTVNIYEIKRIDNDYFEEA